MADTKTLAQTIASLEGQLEGLDDSLRQEEIKSSQMKAAIAASMSQQRARQAQIQELIKDIADLECQLEDAVSIQIPPSRYLGMEVCMQAQRCITNLTSPSDHVFCQSWCC